MDVGTRWRGLRRSSTIRTCLLGIGCLFLIVTPIIGVLPGPGGTFTFAIGAGLVLKNSAWAKRRYVHFKRRWPKSGGWCDWGLRRESARRRHAIVKARGQAARGTAD
jgi:hypothetical protein